MRGRIYLFTYSLIQQIKSLELTQGENLVGEKGSFIEKLV